MTTTEEQAVMTVEYLDPRELTVHPRNVRADLGDLDGLAASIAAQGVIEPITVVPATDLGHHLIVAGHRRVAAAIVAGLDRVPCIVRTDLPVDGDLNQAAHVGAMLAENIHRAGLSAVEEARGVQAMLDLGVPISKVAKQTGLGQRRVKKALGVARLDEQTAAAVVEYQLDLDTAAAIALYADEPDAAAKLIKAAERGPGELAHALERVKRDRQLEEKYQARIAELRGAGRVVVDSTGTQSENLRLTQLNNGDGTWLADQVSEHLSCPGSAIAVVKQWADLYEAEVCTDFRANGHVDRWASPSQKAKPETAEEKATATAERRRVVENNKAMAAANTVRRAWLKEFLGRRSAPAEVLRFAVEEIAGRPHVFAWWLSGNSAPGDKNAAEQLGLEPPVRPWSATRTEKRTTLTTGEHVPDARLPLQLLAHVAGAIELGIGKDSWRKADERRDELVRWLTFLATQGYTLADVEQQIVDGAVQ